MDYTAARREAIVSSAGAYEVTEDEQVAVRRLITRHAQGPDDQRYLLSVLGLATDADAPIPPVSFTPTEKTCRTCGEKKALAEFNRKPGTSDGRDGQCRSCTNTTKRRAYAAKRDAASAAVARSREAADRRRRQAATDYLRAQGLSAREIRSALSSMEGATR